MELALMLQPACPDDPKLDIRQARALAVAAGVEPVGSAEIGPADPALYKQYSDRYIPTGGIGGSREYYPDNIRIIPGYIPQESQGAAVLTRPRSRPAQHRPGQCLQPVPAGRQLRAQPPKTGRAAVRVANGAAGWRAGGEPGQRVVQRVTILN